MEDGHAKTVEQALNFFGTDSERGLTLEQVKANQKKYGPNGNIYYIFTFFVKFAHFSTISLSPQSCLRKKVFKIYFTETK